MSWRKRIIPVLQCLSSFTYYVYIEDLPVFTVQAKHFSVFIQKQLIGTTVFSGISLQNINLR